MIIFTRFLELPDEQMKEIIDYTNSGRPIVGLRTSTHAFNYVKHPDSPYAKYGAQSKDGGFGRQVLGETWIAHYGAHQKESTRGVIVAEMQDHSILRGVRDIWGWSDVYEITSLSGDSQPLVMGQVLLGMDPSSTPDPGKKMMPVAWIKTYAGARVFMTTMGHVMDFKNEGFRRLMVNACYWAMGLEKHISPASNVDLVGEFSPSPIGLKP
jgi:type 1 glutamine amidotransferase